MILCPRPYHGKQEVPGSNPGVGFAFFRLLEPSFSVSRATARRCVRIHSEGCTTECAASWMLALVWDDRPAHSDGAVGAHRHRRRRLLAADVGRSGWLSSLGCAHLPRGRYG